MAKELPMEERLKKIIGDEKDVPSVSGVGESVTVLLVQGLHSGDKDILDKVFNGSDDEVISTTVQQLPVQSVVPLLRELHKRITSKSDIRSYIKWLRQTVLFHDSYLSSESDLVEELRPHYDVFVKRVELLPKMLELQGKLNFLISKMDQANDTSFSKQPALTVFQDVSSSESEYDLDDAPKSDVGETWDDLNWDDEDEESRKNNEKLSKSSENESNSSEEEEMDEEEEGEQNGEQSDDDEDDMDVET